MPRSHCRCFPSLVESAIGLPPASRQDKIAVQNDTAAINDKEQSFALVLVVIVFAIMQEKKNRNWIKRRNLGRLNISPEAEGRTPHEREGSMTAEEKSKVELERLQRLIEDRKQIARETDVSYHLWGLYTSFCQGNVPQPSHYPVQDGEWYDVKILQAKTRNGCSEFEFELKGGKYRFVDDEEMQGWRENTKFFSLFLYDDSDRCLIEIPMKMRIDSSGREYSILSDGPKAFLPGHWTSDFINVRLKHQSIRNQEIRAQKHRERLREIVDLKNRFGIVD